MSSFDLSTGRQSNDEKKQGAPAAAADELSTAFEDLSIPDHVESVHVLGEQVSTICTSLLTQLQKGQPPNVVDLQYIQGWFNEFGSIQATLGISDRASLPQLVWFTQVSCEAVMAGDDKTVLSIEGFDMFQPRKCLHPDIFFEKSPSTKEMIRKMELAAYVDFMKSNEPEFYRKRLAMLTDTFFWIRYLHTILSRYPLDHRFDVIKDGAEEELEIMLCKLLQNSNNATPTFAVEGTRLLQYQNLPIGAEARFQSDNVTAGKHYDISDVVGHVYASDYGKLNEHNERLPELREFNKQSDFAYWEMGTEKESKAATVSTRDAWLLQAFRDWFRNKTDNIDFVEEYCVPWGAWSHDGPVEMGEAGETIPTSAAEHLLSMQKRLQIGRAPIVVCLGSKSWFVAHRDTSRNAQKLIAALHRNKQYADKHRGSLLSALCLWKTLMLLEHHGKLEDDEPCPNWNESDK